MKPSSIDWREVLEAIPYINKCLRDVGLDPSEVWEAVGKWRNATCKTATPEEIARMRAANSSKD